MIKNSLNYIRSLYAEEDDILIKCREKSVEIGKPISISPENGKLIQIIIHMIKAKRILEIGCLVGYSAIWMARALLSNLEEKELITIEKNPEHANFAREFINDAGLSNIIKILEGDALEVITKLEGKFDLVFIDANKSAYKKYLKLIEPIIYNGTVIIADNSLIPDTIASQTDKNNKKSSIWKSKQEFNQLIADKEKFQSIILPYGDGITISRYIGDK